MPGQDHSLTVPREVVPQVSFLMTCSCPLRDSCVLEREFGWWVSREKAVLGGDLRECNLENEIFG